MRNVILLFLILISSLNLSSCAYQYEPLIVPERILYSENVESALVLPFIVSNGKGDVSSVSEMFYSEIARFSEIKIAHFESVLRYLNENDYRIDEANIRTIAYRVGEAFDVEAVFIGRVTEYNGFYPPVLGLSVELLNVDKRQVIAARSEVYDSRFNYVKEELVKYAATTNAHDSLYKDELILRNFNKYIRFVCHRFIEKYF